VQLVLRLSEAVGCELPVAAPGKHVGQ
jgi:hypothetical protein